MRLRSGPSTTAQLTCASTSWDITDAPRSQSRTGYAVHHRDDGSSRSAWRNPADAGNTYYTYDSQGRLTQKCDARPTTGQLAKYSFDHAGNRTNYSNSRTDLSLQAGQILYSPSGNTAFYMQGDSNLVIYDITSSGWVPLWATNTVGSGANVAYFQSDGNLVLYTPQGTPVWQSVTYTNPCASIAVTDAGKVTITNSSGTIVWSAP